MTIHVLHENPAWLDPFARAFEVEGIDWAEWHLDGGPIDLDAAPPEGVFWSRMSASAGTRGHEHAIAHTRAVLDWLEAHGRRVVNGRSALELEVSKAAQHVALQAAGIDVPRTVAVVGDDPDALITAAESIPSPLVVKPNRGGTGWGVVPFDDHAALAAAAKDGSLPQSPDGVRIVQERIFSPSGTITRTELVGGKLLYAVEVDTSEGFELCPADACRADGSSLFALQPEVDPDLVAKYEAFAATHGVQVLAFEHITTADGRRFTYDVNTNTNYNPVIERQAAKSGPGEVARFLTSLR